MAIAYIDKVLVQNPDDLSTTVTIPAGATFCIIGVSWWGDLTINSLSLDSQAAVSIHTEPHSGSYERVSAYSVTGFTTGASKSITCDFSVTPSEGVTFMCLFFSGVDSVHNHDVATTTGSNQTITTPAIASSATDMVVALASGDSGRGSCTMTGGGQTSLYSGTYRTNDYGAGYKAGTGATDTATAVVSVGMVIGVTLTATSVSGSDQSALLARGFGFA